MVGFKSGNSIMKCQFVEKTSKCKGRKKIKVHITVALIVNALEETPCPIVIGMSANPRCFKNVKEDQLSVLKKTRIE